MQCDTNLGYLLHHLTSVLDHQSDVLLQEKLGIGFSQYKILLALQWRSGVQQKQIALWLGQTEASVSRQIKLLLEQGLIENKKSIDNRRQRITVLTAKGDRVAKKATQGLDNLFILLCKNLTIQKQRELEKSLKIMHKQICKSVNQCACR